VVILPRQAMLPGTILKKRIAGWGIASDPISCRYQENSKYPGSIFVEDDDLVVWLYQDSPGWAAVLIGSRVGTLSQSLLESNLFEEYHV